jgi:hypothetical protein
LGGHAIHKGKQKLFPVKVSKRCGTLKNRFQNYNSVIFSSEIAPIKNIPPKNIKKYSKITYPFNCKK